MSELSTTCPYCGVGCGLTVSSVNKAVTFIKASDSHPANLGRICSKGAALDETLRPEYQPERLKEPVVDGEVTGWADATQAAANRIAASIARHGSDSVAFYLSGQLLTEDYYVANKLMKGYIGTANVDTNSRLCMSSAVAAYKRAFGADIVPCSYEDLDVAELIVLIGSNTAWTHPVLFQRMLAAKAKNPDLFIVLIDPRRTATAEIADLHLQITPSSDAYLFAGLLSYLDEKGFVNEAYIAQHTNGFREALKATGNLPIASVAGICDLEPTALEAFFQRFAATRKTISFYSQGINQSESGTDKCNAIINCHLATGKIGYEGAGPFSITGQPNAMGGREVGGLANMLAAHMDFDEASIDRVQRFWQSPTIANKPGLKAVDLFDAIEEGRIKVLWVMATNPAVSLPDTNKVRRALAKCDTVIVSDVTHTDTTEFADILLPAQAWAEKEGTVTNSERRISRQRRFMEPAGEAKPDWWIVSEVAKQLGLSEDFGYQSPREVFVEHARLSGFENQGERAFDISGLASLNQAGYAALSPIQWPVNPQYPDGCQRLLEDGQFFTADGKANFVPVIPRLAASFRRSVISRSEVILNTGRQRDQWHTMTRTGYVPRLSLHTEQSVLELSPMTAALTGLDNGSFAKISNEYGEAIQRVQVSDSVKPGMAFSSMHWNRQFSKTSSVNALSAPVVDPVSGQPELKANSVTVTPFVAKHWWTLFSRASIGVQQDFRIWNQMRVESGWVSTIASDVKFTAEQLLEKQPDCEKARSVFFNPAKVMQTSVFFDDLGIHSVAVEASAASKLPGAAWLVERAHHIDSLTKLFQGENGERDYQVCACFGTTMKQIISLENPNIAEMGATFGCGGKCGSCKPELAKFSSDSLVANEQLNWLN